MKQIIAIQGKGNIGKTSTLRELHDSFLLKNGCTPIIGKYEDHGVDFLNVLEKNGKLIGITSAGDNYYLVHEGIKILIELECTIIICACRTRGGSMNAIEEFTDYRSEYIPKTIALSDVENKTVNEKDAKIIFEKVEELVTSNKAETVDLLNK